MHGEGDVMIRTQDSGLTLTLLYCLAPRSEVHSMIWLWLYLNLIFSINNPLEIGIVVGQLSCMNVHGQHCRLQSRANV